MLDRQPPRQAGGDARRVRAVNRRQLQITPAADSLFSLLQSVNREHGTAIPFVTHNEALVSRCDRNVRVADGRIVAA